MMKTARRVILLVAIVLLVEHSAQADSITLISQTGTGTSGWTTGAEETNAFSWSSTLTSINTTISAKLLGESTGSSYTAYLTTQLGPALTSADILMTRDFQLSFNATEWVDVFSDLTLGPGTYYVVLAGNHGGWASTSPQTELTTIPGVTYNGSYFATEAQADYNRTFPLVSNYFRFEDYGSAPLQFSIVGNVSPVPEPSTLLLLGSGLAGILLFSSRFGEAKNNRRAC